MKKVKSKTRLSKPLLDEVPEECEICLNPSDNLTLNEETKEWICPKCKNDLGTERRIYEDHFSFSHHYYMNNCEKEDEEES